MGRNQLRTSVGIDLENIKLWNKINNKSEWINKQLMALDGQVMFTIMTITKGIETEAKALKRQLLSDNKSALKDYDLKEITINEKIIQVEDYLKGASKLCDNECYADHLAITRLIENML